MALRKLTLRQHPMPNFKNIEHYLIFGPKTFHCGYTDEAVDMIHESGEKPWLRKVSDIRTLYFPNTNNQPTKTRFNSYPQIYFWNRDLRKYRHIGGVDSLKKQLKRTYSNSYSSSSCRSCG